MRLHPRHQPVAIAKTQLELKLHAYSDEREIEDVEMLRLVTLEIRQILLDMEPAVKHASHYSDMKDMIRAHKEEHGLTDIEVLQALFSHCESILKYMLRWERHKDYDKPAGEE